MSSRFLLYYLSAVLLIVQPSGVNVADQIRNVFVSHVHADDAQVTALTTLLSNHKYDVRNSSIDSSNPNDANNEDYIKYQILAPRIDWCGAMIVLISPETHTSDWVNWEIEYAFQQDKQIVGVWCPGATDADKPEALERLGDGTVVSWRGEQIISALNGDQNWENPQGLPEPPKPFPQYTCGYRG